MRTFCLLLTASLGMGACGAHEAHAEKGSPSQLNATAATETDSSAEPAPASSETPPASGDTQAPTAPDSDKPADGKPADDKPVDDDALPIESVDGKARVLALAEIAEGYDCILSINAESAEKAKSVTKAFGAFDGEAHKLIDAMEKLPATSSKRKILLGQLRTLAAKLYDQLAVLHAILPNNQENADAILAIVAKIDAFRSI